MPVNMSNLRLKWIFFGKMKKLYYFVCLLNVDANKTYLEAYDVHAVIELFFPYALKISKSAPACM